MIIFQGNDKIAYRDPAAYLHEGIYYLFFTISEKEDGYMYNYVAMSWSKDLKEWSKPRKLTPKDRSLNYCSPGNVIEHNGEYIVCFSSYPLVAPFTKQYWADDNARLFIMKTKDFQEFSNPELLNPKDGIPEGDIGRMIDPFIFQKDGMYYLFFKQNGISFSRSTDLLKWEYGGKGEGGENACVIEFEGQYLLIHSPKNGICFSISDDLIHWRDYHFTTLEQEKWDWAKDRITAAFSMEMSPDFAYRYAMFFHGSKSVFPETHGNATLAVAFTNDFKTFVYEF